MSPRSRPFHKRVRVAYGRVQYVTAWSMTPRAWDRRLWGVEFESKLIPPLLLGGGWCAPTPEHYSGEPSRALLFTTRGGARRWCQEQRASYAKSTDVCRTWRFRPVRVRETVRKVGR